MNNGAFGENFPYSNCHDLNMDWIIKIAKDFLDQYTHIQEIIENGEESLTNLTQQGLTELEEKSTELEGLLQAWYNEHSEDIATELEQAVVALGNALASNIQTLDTHADQKLAQTLASIPSDYTDVYNRLVKMEGTTEKEFVGLNNGSGISYMDSLTATFNSNTNLFTLTVNKSFICYGLVGLNRGLYSFGSSDTNADYKFTNTSISVTEPGVIMLVGNNTNHHVELVSNVTFRTNPTNYIIIGYFYRDTNIIVFGETRTLFTNSNVSMNYKTANNSLKFMNGLCNFMTIIRGSINYITATHRIILENVLLYPTYNYEWTLAINETIDFSTVQYPDNLKVLLYNTVTGTLKLYSIPEDNPNQWLYEHKSEYAVICAVYQKKMIWIPSTAEGHYYVDYEDVNGKPESSFKYDLYKVFQKVAVCGDSLAVGYSYEPTTHQTVRRNLPISWPRCVARDSGFPWICLGQAGQTVLTWCSDATYGLVQARATGNKAQLYIIGLGENDQFNNEVPLGTESDVASADINTPATTFYEGYERIIKLIRSINPSAYIFCLTNPNPNGNRPAYNQAVKYIAETVHNQTERIYLVDMSNYTPQIRNSDSLIYLDNVYAVSHYSANGYRMIASMMEEVVSNVVKNTLQGFKAVEFVPFDTQDPTPDTTTT